MKRNQEGAQANAGIAATLGALIGKRRNIEILPLRFVAVELKTEAAVEAIR